MISSQAQSSSQPESSFQPKVSSTAAVLLAAGAGSRLSSSDELHKLRRPIQDKPLVLWAVAAALEADLAETYVVVGAEDLSDLLPPEVTVICNHDWAKGQGSSLRSATLVAGQDGHDAIVVGLGDMPFVTAEAWQAVANIPGAIVTNTYHGKRRPPVKLDAEVWPLLPLFEDDEGARGLMRRRPELVTEVTCNASPQDFDTEYDFSRYQGSRYKGKSLKNKDSNP